MRRNPLHSVTDGDGRDIGDAAEGAGADIFTAWRLSKATITLIVLISGTGAAQLYLAGGHDLSLIAAGGFSGQALADGRWWSPVTSMYLHGGVAHFLFNVSALLAFGPALARRLGNDLDGELRLLGLYTVAGLAGVLVYWAFHPDGQMPMVGASGAIFGLWGALARFKSDADEIQPIVSRHVLDQAFGAVLSNFGLLLLFIPSWLMLGVLGLAWEAHLGGFIAGLLLVGFFRPGPTAG